MGRNVGMGVQLQGFIHLVELRRLEGKLFHTHRAWETIVKYLSWFTSWDQICAQELRTYTTYMRLLHHVFNHPRCRRTSSKVTKRDEDGQDGNQSASGKERTG